MLICLGGRAYDLADRITQISYPSGRLVAYAYDTKGRVSSVQTKASASDPSWTVLASGATYEPFGSVKTLTLGNGLSLANDWGNDGRLDSRRLYVTSTGTNLSWLTYLHDPNDNVGAIRDQLDYAKSVYYGYDANDRLAFASMTVGSPAASTETYSYTSGTNRLASVTNASGSYDNRGNTSSETRPVCRARPRLQGGAVAGGEEALTNRHCEERSDEACPERRRRRRRSAPASLWIASLRSQ